MRCPISAAKIRSSKIWIPAAGAIERLPAPGIDDQRAAMRRGDENFRHLFGIERPQAPAPSAPRG
ncbi:hypothetical protein LNP74_15585 [Klebsiella pneumoniae subsp. pneumoniae]|nr:hypothetical protein [Klebsiella pneumoniae subsp. pneumoniae]